MSRIRTAVIGAGHLGRIHTKLLSQIDSADVVAVCDPDPNAKRLISEQFDVPLESDYRRLIGQIDAAVIATPTRFHFNIAADLISNGIHCLIEKPLTDSVSDAMQLVQLAEKNRCVVSVGHCERYNAATQAAIAEVGSPKFIQSARMSGYTFRSTDIGVVHDLMIHDIDLVNSVFPGHVVDVRATGVSVFGKNEDIAQARVQFSCGGVANLTASRCSFEPERSMQVFGTEGFAKANLADQTIEAVRVPTWIRKREFDFDQTTLEQQAFVREKLFDSVLQKRTCKIEPVNAIMAEQQDWLDCIADGSQPKISVEHGMQAVEIAQHILDSIERHAWDQDRSLKGALATPFIDQPFGDPLPQQLRHAEIRRAA